MIIFLIIVFVQRRSTECLIMLQLIMLQLFLYTDHILSLINDVVFYNILLLQLFPSDIWEICSCYSVSMKNITN